MRKITTLGLTAFAGTVLAFGSPIAAHATTTTPYRDSMCAASNIPAALTSGLAQQVTAVSVNTGAVVTEATKAAALVTASNDLGAKLGDYIHALDNGPGTVGTVANTKALLDASVNAYSVAGSEWIAARNALVVAGNGLAAANFNVAYIQSALTALACP